MWLLVRFFFFELVCRDLAKENNVADIFFTFSSSSSSSSLNYETVNVKNVKLCMMTPLIEHYPFVPTSMTLSISKGHSSIKQC